MNPRGIFITGGTGYIGRQLIPRLLTRGHRIHALVRNSSTAKLPADCHLVQGNALEQETFASRVHPADTFIQLVGVPHPSPSKGEQFRAVDLVSVQASVAAAIRAKVQHFIYLSVAPPAPMMEDYIAVRAAGEALLRESRLNVTVLRPWYVLGPGHWWPVILQPVYWVARCFPATRDSAHRLGLVTLNQMLSALVNAVENPARGVRVMEVPEIRAAQV